MTIEKPMTNAPRVIPAKAGMTKKQKRKEWIPACAGMTRKRSKRRSKKSVFICVHPWFAVFVFKIIRVH